ncbi:MAG: hypothetical protein RLZZ502_892 [Pseudomonadota bacterium]|jgi:Arc/MetJ-type ribon-helix-helix transcriptional regulator
MGNLDFTHAFKTTVNLSPALKADIDSLLAQGAARNQSQFITMALEAQVKQMQKKALYKKMRQDLLSLKPMPKTRPALLVREELRAEMGGR